MGAWCPTPTLDGHSPLSTASAGSSQQNGGVCLPISEPCQERQSQNKHQCHPSLGETEG